MTASYHLTRRGTRSRAIFAAQIRGARVQNVTKSKFDVPDVVTFSRAFAMLVSGRSSTGFSRMSTARFSLLRVLADGEIHSAEQIGRILGRSPDDVGVLVVEIEALGLRVLKTQA